MPHAGFVNVLFGNMFIRECVISMCVIREGEICECVICIYVIRECFIHECVIREQCAKQKNADDASSITKIRFINTSHTVVRR